MMQFFERYDWRTRNRLLGVGALVFLLACYQLAIKPTWKLRTTYMQMEEEEVRGQANRQQLAQLRAQVRSVGAGNPYMGTPEPERIADMAQGHAVNVRSLPIAERLTAEALSIQYAQYQVEGTFRNLLNLLLEVEGQPDINVVNASFIKQPHPVTRMPELRMQIGTARVANE